MRTMTRDEIRAVDQWAIERLGVPGIVLMENAGRGAADEIMRFLELRCGPPGLHDARVAIVAGAGNNGGDGFVVARHLAIRGLRPSVFLLADPGRLTGDARTNFEIARNISLPITRVVADGAATAAEQAGVELPTLPLERLAAALGEFDLVVDAIGGTGIAGPLRGPTAEAVRQTNAAGRPIVAIDIPTGLDCDTGLAPGETIRAALTVTMHARKRGFDHPAAAEFTGPVVVVDIGISPATCGNDEARMTNDEGRPV